VAKQNNPFLTAHYEKIALTEQTSKRIQLIYKQSAQDIEKKLRNLPMRVPSDTLKKLYLENLLKDINKSSESFNRLIESTIRNSGEQSGLLAIEAGNKAAKSLGLDIKGAYSYIPRQEVLNIASGKLYGNSWTLSQSIWKNGLRTKSDIQNVVAKGLTENKPIKDIADDLMKYVDPTARKPWDWSKVYPGTATKVDYNAQRLARTMIQHSFQSSLVQSQRYNPFCQGIIWHSVGIHGRTCEECMERDGNVYPVKDLPLDHPNGLCYFEPALDSMNTVADRLADWVNGKDDPELDAYVSKAFNMSPKSPEGKAKVQDVKQSTPAAMNKTEFVDQNFNNLKKKVIMSQTTKKEGEEIWTALRARMIELEEDQLRYMATGQKRLTAIIPSPNLQKAYYTPSKMSITVDLKADMMNKHHKGAFATFFHEYGHHIDHIAIKAHKPFFTDNTKFRNTLYSSLEKEYNKLCKNGKLLYSVRKDLRNAHPSEGVQDIISGLSLNENRVFWGHSTDYWEKGQGQKERVIRETMAHFNAAWANPESEAFMKKYFPESYEYIMKEAKAYVKKASKI
jgi:hypothetical protein